MSWGCCNRTIPFMPVGCCNNFPFGYSVNLGAGWRKYRLPYQYSLCDAIDFQNMGNPYKTYIDFMSGIARAHMPDVAQVQSNQMAAEQGYATGFTMGVNTRIQSCGRAIDSLISDLKNALNSGKLNADQKSRVQSVLDKVNELKERHERLIEMRNNGASYNEIDNELIDINEKLRNLSSESRKLAEKIKNELEESSSADNDDDADGVDGSDGSDDGDADGADGADDGDGGGSTPPVTPPEQTPEEKILLDTMCKKIDDAIRGMGTNYDDNENGLKYIIEAVTPDIVIELFDHWNNGLAQTDPYVKDDPKGFIESLMDDCEGDQKKEIGTMLVDALNKRAAVKGIDVHSEVAAARSALSGSFFGLWHDDDDICDAINAIVQKIKDAESGGSTTDESTTTTDTSETTDDTETT